MENNKTDDVMGKVKDFTTKITAYCDEQGVKVIDFLKAKIPALSKYKMSQVLLYTNLAATVLTLLLYFVAPAISKPDSKELTKKESCSISAMVSLNNDRLDKIPAKLYALIKESPKGESIKTAESYNFYARFFLLVMVVNIALGIYMFVTKKVIPYFSIRWVSKVSFLAMLILFFKNISLANSISNTLGGNLIKIDVSTSFGPILMLLITLVVAFSGFLIPANKED